MGVTTKILLVVSLAVLNWGCTEGFKSVDLRGLGTDGIEQGSNEPNPLATANLLIEHNGNTILDSQVAPINFGSISSSGSESSSVEVFSLTNSGDGILTFTNIRLTGDAEFSVNPTGVFILGKGQIRNLPVTYRPNGSGSHSASLLVSFSINGKTGSFSVDLIGSMIDEPTPSLGIFNGPNPVNNNESFTLGSATQGMAGQNQTLIVQNTGSADLNISASLSDSTNFRFAVAPPATVPAGNSAQFTVQSVTDNVGSHSSNLVITSNDPNNGSLTLSFNHMVNAPATAPEISVLRADSEIPSGTNTNLGSAQQDMAGGSATFTIQNSGDGDLNVTPSLSNSTNFSITPTTLGPISPGASATVMITAITAAVGSFSTNLSLASNDADESNLSFGFTSTVTAPPEPEPDPASQISVFSDANPVSQNQMFNLGTAQEGSNAGTTTLTIRNDGEANLTLSAALDSATHFTITSSPSASVSPTATTSITVQARPSAAGDFLTNLRITTNDPTHPSFVVRLSATGTPIPLPDPAELSVSVNGTNITSGQSQKFADRVVGDDPVQLTVRIQNSGEQSLELNGVRLLDGASSQIALLNNVPSSLAAGAGANINFRLTPSEAGEQLATFEIRSDDASNPVFNVPLVGLVHTQLNVAEKTNAPSPFDIEQVQIDGLADNNTISVERNLVAVVSESCRYGRVLSGDSGNYFINALIPAATAPASNDKVGQESYNFNLVSSMTVASLKSAVESDSCLIGIAGATAYAATSYSDPQYSNQNYLTAMRFQGTRAYYDAELSGRKVQVAVLDSGFDSANSDAGEQAEFNDSYNILENNNDTNDVDGHGTKVSSLINARGDTSGIVGVAAGTAVLHPIKVFHDVPEGPFSESNLEHLAHFEENALDSRHVFKAITRAVNGGAEVINLSISHPKSVCDPVVGHAIYKGIEKGVFFTIASGHVTNVVNGNPVRGNITSPSNFSPWTVNNTASPACWGRYFKGAITVGALDNGNNFADFSNFGTGVELGAPGTGILTYGLANQLVTDSGSSYSTALVSGAVAKMIAFHKAKGWLYSPWLLEDILLNASPERVGLRNFVHNGKHLDFTSLRDYLEVLKTRSPSERLREPSDNPEVGQGFLLGQASGPLSRLEVVSSNPIVNRFQRARLNSILHYQSGAQVVNSDSVAWTVSPNTASVSSDGIFYPGQVSRGVYTVTASFQGLSASTDILVTEQSVVTGAIAPIERLQIVPDPWQLSGWNSWCGWSNVEVFAHYEDGLIRRVASNGGNSSPASVFAYNDANEQIYGHNGFYSCYQYGGRQIRVVSQYAEAAGVTVRGEELFTLPTHGQAGSIEIANNQPDGTALGKQPDLDFSYIHSDGERHPVGKLANTKYFVNGIEAPPTRLFEQMPTAGTYTVSVQGAYRGNGTEDVLTASTEVTVYASVITAIHLSRAPNVVVPLQAIGHHGHEEYTYKIEPYVLVTRSFNGTTSTERATTEEFADITAAFTTSGDSEPGTFGFQRGAREWKVGVYSENGIGDEYTFTITHGPTGATDNWTFSTYGSLDAEWARNQPESYPVMAEPQASIPDGYCTPARMAASPMAGGSGTETDPFTICTVDQFLAMDDSLPRLSHVHLKTNLDFEGVFIANPIRHDGPFNGNGYQISNFTMIDSEKDNVSLFAREGKFTLKNLGLFQPFVRGRRVVGAVVYTAGTNDKKVILENVWVKDGVVWGQDIVGGIAGHIYEHVTGLVNWNTEIRAEGRKVGGIAGSASANLFDSTIIEDSFSTGSVISIGPPGSSTSLGGLIGEAGAGNQDIQISNQVLELSSIEEAETTSHQLIVRNSFATGDVRSDYAVSNVPCLSQVNDVWEWTCNSESGRGHNAVGGLIGTVNDAVIIYNTYATGNVISMGQSVGGLIGHAKGWAAFSNRLVIANSYALGNVTGQSYVGGLIGTAQFAMILDCDSRNFISGLEEVGGFVGNSNVHNIFRGNTANPTFAGAGTAVNDFIGISQGVPWGLTQRPADIIE